MQVVAPLLLALTLASCAAVPGSSPTPTAVPEESLMATSEPTPTPTTTPTPTATSSPTLKLSSEQPSPDPADAGEELTGVLGADSIEGGCGYLRAPGGTRYEVIYPDGWDLQLSPPQLTSPDGEVIARGGDEVTVRGAEASDMASICQIGPIFRATEVVVP